MSPVVELSCFRRLVNNLRILPFGWNRREKRLENPVKSSILVFFNYKSVFDGFNEVIVRLWLPENIVFPLSSSAAANYSHYKAFSLIFLVPRVIFKKNSHLSVHCIHEYNWVASCRRQWQTYVKARGSDWSGVPGVGMWSAEKTGKIIFCCTPLINHLQTDGRRDILIHTWAQQHGQQTSEEAFHSAERWAASSRLWTLVLPWGIQV